MLFSLHIENIAVVKSLDVDFSRGFMALTGETGAGKSIILDSINLLLGKKAEKELIRHGEDRAMVSGLFGELGENVVKTLNDAGISVDDEGEILIQRSVDRDGHSQIRVNGRSISLAVLRNITQSLVVIHGQNDTLSLTDAQKQLELLDRYAENSADVLEYTEEFEKLSDIRRKIKEIIEKAGDRERLIEIYKYQLEDIDSVAIRPGEEDELLDKKAKLKNSERITKNAGFTFKALKGSEKGSVSFLLDRSIVALEQLSDVVPELSDSSEKLRDILYQIDDISERVYSVYSELDEHPEDSLNKIESRLAKIAKFKRKYGDSEEKILAFRDKIEQELENLENSDSVLEQIYETERIAYNRASKLAEKIHNKRVAAAKLLDESVKSTLEFLDMPKVVFFTSVKEEYKAAEKVLTATGSDKVEFFISTNKGAEPKPLSKIASGGELARVMLAIKSVMADKDDISTLIFDEIDTGVSGKTARKIGIKLLELSSSAQLFSVTHSAQIASLADKHFLISKRETESSVETKIVLLSRDGRINELSRILGGINVTDAQKKAAIDMLDERENYI